MYKIGSFEIARYDSSGAYFSNHADVERGSQSEYANTVELASDGHGKHRASRVAGDGADCGREGGKLYPDRIGGEMVARRAGGVRG